MIKIREKYAAFIRKTATLLALVLVLDGTLNYLPALPASASGGEGSVFVDEMALKDESGRGSVSGSEGALTQEESGTDGTREESGADGVDGTQEESGTEGIDETEAEIETETETETEGPVSGNEGAADYVLALPLSQGRTITEEAGKSDLRVDQRIVSPAGEIVRTQQKIKLEIQYDMAFPDDKLLKSSYTMYFPDGIRADTTVSANILAGGAVIGSASCEPGAMTIRFDKNAAGDSLVVGGVMKVNEQNAAGRVYKNVSCQMQVPVTYTPSDNSGHEELVYSYGDASAAKTPWPEVKLTADYKPMPVSLSVEQECVKQSGADAGYYKCTTTIIPGNLDSERKERITIAQELKDFKLASDKGVSFTVKDKNGGVIPKKTVDPVPAGGLTQHETSAPDGSVTGHIAYAVDGFAKDSADAYAEDDRLIFTYFVKENPAIYNQSDPRTLSAAAGVFDSAAFSEWDMNAGRIQPEGGLKEKSVKITPKPVSYSYKVKEENGKKYLEWTVTVNGNGISMYRPELTFSLADKDKAYLNIIQGSMTQTASSFVFGYEQAGLNTVKFTGTMPGSGSGGLLSASTEVTFRTDITDAFYEEKGGAYTFDAAVSLTWYDSDTAGTGVSAQGKWDDSLSRPVFDEKLIKKSGGFDAAEGCVDWTLTVNAPQISLTNVVITDQLPAAGAGRLELTGVSLKQSSGTKTPLTEKSQADFDAAVSAGRDGGIYTVDADNRLRIYAGDLTESAPAERTREYIVGTRVSDGVRYGNQTESYSNAAAVSAKSAGGPVEKTDTAKPVVYKSELLDKKGDYQKSALAVDWTVTLNASKTALTGMKLEDTIPAGLAYDPAAGITVKKNGTSYTMPPGSADASQQSVKLDFSGENTLGNTYEISYRTLITDVTLLDQNTPGGGTAVINRAELKSDEITAAGTTVIKEASVQVPVSVIRKQQTPGKANQLYTQWEVTVNDDHQDLCGSAGTAASASISDSYASYDKDGRPIEGIRMLFRPSDMTLTANFNGGGSEEFSVLPESMATGPAGTQAVVSFDQDARKFSVALPIQKGSRYAQAEYKLVYKIRTEEPDASVTKFQIGNNAVFTCDRGRGVPPQSTGVIFSDLITVGSISGGGTVDPDYRKITVKKADGSKPLAGAVFELVSIYGVEQTKTTDASGNAVFENVSSRLDYTIREKRAPEGYLLPGGVQSVPAGGGDVTVTVAGEKAKGDIVFQKTGERPGGGSAYAPLAGAKFRLYERRPDGSQGNATSFEAVSKTDGTVLFQAVPYGNYVIREIQAPSGYALSGSSAGAGFSQPVNGQAALKLTLSGSGDFDAAAGQWKNRLVRARITVQLDRTGSLEPVTGSSAQGVHVILKDRNGNIAAEKTVAASDASVAFDGIPYGSYSLYVEGVIQKTLLTYENALEGKVMELDHTSLNADGSLREAQADMPCEDAPNKVTVLAVDRENPGKLLPGCRIALYRRSLATGAGTAVISGTTDADGRIVFYLPDSPADSEYVLRQLTTVGSYEVDQKVYSFTLAAGAAGEERSEVFYNPLQPDWDAKREEPRPVDTASRKKGRRSGPGQTAAAQTARTEPAGQGETARTQQGETARKEQGGETKNEAGRLPKTGGFLDLTTLILLGTALILSGGTLIYSGRRKKKCGKQRENS